MFGKQSEFDRGIELVKQFCQSKNIDPAKTMSTETSGVVRFSFELPLNNGSLMPVHFYLVPEGGANNPARILIGSPVAPVENIPAKVREEFFRALLTENMRYDTACICISPDNHISAKADRIIRGLDFNELQDMATVLTALSANLNLEICPRYNVKTSAAAPRGGITFTGTAKGGGEVKVEIPKGGGGETAPSATLEEIQKFVIKVIEKGDSLAQTGNHAQCYRVYYDSAHKIGSLLAARGKGFPAFDALRKSLKKAMGDSQVEGDDSKKCAMVRQVFDETLQMKV